MADRFSPAIRLRLTLLGGSSMNLVYISGNVASAFIYRSIWSATVTVYHLTLIVMRIYLIYVGRRSAGERICRRVGAMLLVTDLAAGIMMIYSLRLSNFASYSGFILIGFTVFTAYSLLRSAFDIRRHVRGGDRLYFCARSISLSTSLMSVFNLQYSLFSLLGADYMITYAGIILCGLIVFSVMLHLSFGLIRRGIGR